VFGIFSPDESVVIGGSGLHPRIGDGGLEIGYWIRASQTGHGFATETARALTAAGLRTPGIDRIQILCDPDNTASRRVPEKLGYRLIETRYGDKLAPGGTPRNTVVFEQRREWMPDQPVPSNSSVTIHMAASLDGFIARRDGGVDWLETSDEFEAGETLEPDVVESFLATIDCYVMGSRTYETALGFEAKGLGWAYGDKPTFVLTSRELPRRRETVEFYSGDLRALVSERLRPTFRNIWVVGGGKVAGECLRLGLADEVRYSIVPVVIGDGVPFFEGLDRDVELHLLEAKAYRNGTVALRHEVRRGGRRG
jgi:dihydrofolate reductase